MYAELSLDHGILKDGYEMLNPMRSIHRFAYDRFFTNSRDYCIGCGSLAGGELGHAYKTYLFIALPITGVLLTYLTIDLRGWLPNGTERRLEAVSVPFIKEHQQSVKAARKTIEEGKREGRCII